MSGLSKRLLWGSLCVGLLLGIGALSGQHFPGGPAPCRAADKAHHAPKAPPPGEAAKSDKDFTIVVLPDPQHYARKLMTIGMAQTEWIKSNVDKLNIRFACTVGDNVDAGWSLPQYKNSVSFMDVLKGVLPYGVACGNHDLMDGKKGFSCRNFLTHYGPQTFKECKWYGGASESGFSSYQHFTGGGQKFLAVELAVNAPKPEIEWARKILAAHPKTPAILITHQFLGVQGHLPETTAVSEPDRQNPQQIWEELVNISPQIFMVICGHYHGEAYLAKKNKSGLPVHILLQDYQNDENGGNGWLRIYTFRPDKNKVEIQTYSPTLKQYQKDPKSQFDIDLDFKRFQNPAKADTSAGLPQPLPLAG